MPPDIRIEVAHTSALPRVALEAARDLMDVAFEGDFDEEDWEHALGGMHALVWDGPVLVAHGAIVQRRLLHRGRALRCGYVEAVAVHPARQRQGLGNALMTELERVIRGAYDLGALSTTEAGLPLYCSRGWLLWTGPTFALTPSGVVHTEDDDGSVLVLPVAADLRLDEPLTCDWRDGDPW